MKRTRPRFTIAGLMAVVAVVAVVLAYPFLLLVPIILIMFLTSLTLAVLAIRVWCSVGFELMHLALVRLPRRIWAVCRRRADRTAG